MFLWGPCFQGPFNTLFDVILQPFLETVWTRKRAEAPKRRPKEGPRKGPTDAPLGSWPPFASWGPWATGPPLLPPRLLGSWAALGPLGNMSWAFVEKLQQIPETYENTTLNHQK